MPTWSPTTYLAFEDERSRPFVDLLSRVDVDARSIVDLGCGPGHLSAVLRARWPDAEITGVDSSPQMIERARADDTTSGATYELGDVATWTTDERPDLIVSNATFQWVPDRLEVISRLRDLVAPGGAFAFQVPANYDAPSHVLLREIAGREPYAEHTSGLDLHRGVPTRTYLDLLSGPGWRLDAWETTYLHLLAGDDAVFAWISGTGARPVLQALPDDLRARFAADYKAALREAYPRQPHGTVLPFARSFVVASRA